MLIVLATTSHTRLDSLPVGTLASILAVSLITFAVPLSTFESFSPANLVGDTDLFVDTLPAHVDTVSVVKSLKDSVAADHDKIEVILHLEALDIWLTNNNIRVSTIPRSLCLNVSESLGN